MKDGWHYNKVLPTDKTHWWLEGKNCGSSLCGLLSHVDNLAPIREEEIIEGGIFGKCKKCLKALKKRNC